ncbi:hypothetical protein FI667_g2768, partial [Globisporangium splendens]
MPTTFVIAKKVDEPADDLDDGSIERFVLGTGRARRLISSSPSSCNAIKKKPVLPKTMAASIRELAETAVVVEAQMSTKTGWCKLFARRGFLCVESDFFHARFLVREIIEYVSQTVQYSSPIGDLHPVHAAIRARAVFVRPVADIWRHVVWEPDFGEPVDLCASVARVREDKRAGQIKRAFKGSFAAEEELEQTRRRVKCCNLQLTAYKCVQYFFVFVGTVILVAHIVAVQPRSGAASSGCKDARYPWFTSKFSCAIYEFNCYRQESVTPEETTLEFLNEGTLTVLLPTHCPALVVPKSIQNFPNLLGMEIYNSTIVEWSKEAALSPSIHQKMVFFVFSRVNMTGLPDGILQPLPEKLQDMEISITNLTSLPDTLHKTWYAMSVLHLEYSQIQMFPETLYKMVGLSDFSMIGNQLEYVPDLLSLKAELFFLALSHNPLTSLPKAAESGAGLACEHFSLEGTNLEEIPGWMDTSIGELVYLSGSPVCAPRSGGKAAVTARSGKFVCDQVDDRGDGRYPLTMMEPLRQP